MNAHPLSMHNLAPLILVVDDYPPFLEMLEMTLSEEGYQVWCAANGQDALNKLLVEYRQQYRVPDLILADIMMPGMDGYAFYERVRENPYLNHIPFIFLTAKATDADIRRGKELGVEDYLCKPCSGKDLLASVRGKLWRVEQQKNLVTQFIGDPDKALSGGNTVLLAVGVALILAACIVGALVAINLF